MLIRIRSNVGIWRVEVDDTATPSDIPTAIASMRPHVVYESSFCHDAACSQPLDESLTLAEQNITHGSMIHCRVDPSTCVDIILKSTTMNTEEGTEGGSSSSSAAVATAKGVGAAGASYQNSMMKRVIDADGTIRLIPTMEAPTSEDKGFRKGMMALRDIKMAWTLNEFVAMDSQFEFKLKRQEESVCKGVSLDIPSVSDFQAHLQRFQFQRKRIGFLYGTFQEDTNQVRVEAIYEPPQQPDPDAAEGFEQLDDPLEDNVEQMAQFCGLRKVGWIFGHAARDTVLTAAEIIMAAELQLEAAGGVEETPFVTVKVAMAKDGTVAVEAFQVSQQCMAMVAEEALEIGPDPSVCQVNETFTAIQEGKPSKTVENSFFLTVVPIVQHTSEMFVAQFPRLNRDLDDRTPSKEELKKQLSKSGSAGWSFVDLLADFNLLIYLSNSLDVHQDFPKICQSIVNREVPLDDGYKILIASVAGLDGAY